MTEKFDAEDWIIDSELWQFPVEEIGDVTENGTWYGLVIGPFLDEVIDGEALPPAGATIQDILGLLRAAGAILQEDAYGRKYATIYPEHAADELEHDWKKIQEEVSDYYAEDPE